MNKKLLLLGGGGHCQSVLDSLLSRKEYEAIAIVDKALPIGSRVMGVPVAGRDADLKKLYQEGYHEAFLAAGSVGDPMLRKKLWQRIGEAGFTIPVIIDPTACVSRSARVERGVFIGKRAVVNAGAIIGKAAIINTGAIIEHGCIIGDWAHAAPGAVVNGEVHIGEGTHIGSGALIKQQVTIGEYAVIGMGSVVLGDIDSHVTAYGNPCREVKKRCAPLSLPKPE